MLLNMSYLSGNERRDEQFVEVLKPKIFFWESWFSRFRHPLAMVLNVDLITSLSQISIDSVLSTLKLKILGLRIVKENQGRMILRIGQCSEKILHWKRSDYKSYGLYVEGHTLEVHFRKRRNAHLKSTFSSNVFKFLTFTLALRNIHPCKKKKVMWNTKPEINSQIFIHDRKTLFVLNEKLRLGIHDLASSIWMENWTYAEHQGKCLPANERIRTLL